MEDQYQLRVLEAPDYEVQRQYKTVLECQDRGKEALKSLKSVFVHVLDVNDNSPVFKEEVYAQNIREDVPLESFVLRVGWDVFGGLGSFWWVGVFLVGWGVFGGLGSFWWVGVFLVGWRSFWWVGEFLVGWGSFWWVGGVFNGVVGVLVGWGSFWWVGEFWWAGVKVW